MMKKINILLILCIFLAVSCSPKEDISPDNLNEIKNITISLGENEHKALIGNEYVFKIESDTKRDISSLSEIYINGNKISGNTYIFTEEGNNEVYAKYKTSTSPKVQIKSIKPTHTTKVIIEDFTGTWCGYCPNAAYYIEKIHDEFSKKVIPIAIHGGDEFSYSKFSVFEVNRFPTVTVNKKFDLESKNQISKLTEKSKNLGLAINYNLENNKVVVKIRYDIKSLNEKLVVYILEDKLIADQANYGNDDPDNLAYQKGNPIKNFEHNDVLRVSLTNPLGDKIPETAIKDNVYTVEYDIANKKEGITTFENTKIAAYVINRKNEVVNAQVAAVNEDKDFD